MTQEQTAAPFELRDAFAFVLAGAREHLPDGEDREIVEDCAREALAALDTGKEPPRRLVATLKGILGDVAAGAGRGFGTSAAAWATDALSNLG
ncbi:hypothetical protein [Microbacterium sp. LWS13-1.2]|uniref:Uncharacterized protein n=1 Tax=Microbacterium sp. LWS13-1.2 TaxID=3135264 RepID=A0AAU6SG32_9MICO